VPKSFRTGDYTLVREFNRAILLNLLRVHSPQSRADLAAAAGLNKTTVSSLVADMIDAQLVREIGHATSAGGRPAVLLELNPEAGCIIGVELGIWHINIALTDFRAGVLWKQNVTLDPAATPASVIAKTIELAHSAADFAGQSGRKVLGLGLAVPGLLDVESGTLLFGQNMGWREVPIRRPLEAAFAFPIFVDNDAKASTIGERYFGVAQQCDNFVYVCANVGLGAGIWQGNQVYRGETGFAGEVGHTTFQPDGPVCSCGNSGCWEMYASQKALIERLRAGVAAGRPTSLPTNGGRLAGVTMPLIVNAARAGEALVLQALDETGVYLGLAIANLINTFNPKMVVFGGALSLAADYLLPVIQHTVAARAIPWSRAATQIVVAAHQVDSGVMGAVALVLNDILSHPRLDVAVKGRLAERRVVRKEVRPLETTAVV